MPVALSTCPSAPISPPIFAKSSSRKCRPLPHVTQSNLRPLNVDVPDAVLPRRYKHHAVLLDDLKFDLDTDMDKIECAKSSSPASSRPCSEFPLRAGQTVYVGRRTLRFYLQTMRNLVQKVLLRRCRSRKDMKERRTKTKRRKRSPLDVVRNWIEKKRKRQWIEPRRHDGRDLRIFYGVFNLIDRRYRGARFLCREELFDNCVYYRLKFKHFWRGKVEVLEPDLYSAAKEMQYELEFEEACRDEDRFAKLFQIIDKKCANARVMHKVDKYGRRHVKVEHPVCGFRVCSPTIEDSIAYLCELYEYNIGVRSERHMKRWRDIFDAIDMFYPGSKLFYQQVSHGSWHAKVIHEVQGLIASGRSCTLDYALAQLRNDLERHIELSQTARGSTSRWRC